MPGLPRSIRHTAVLLALGFSSFAPQAFSQAQFAVQGSAGSGMIATAVAQFDRPWAMTFVDSNRLLVTEKGGTLWLAQTDGKKRRVAGVPRALVGGQGGLGDVVLHPDFNQNGWVYMSMVEGDRGSRGAVVFRGQLDLETARLSNLQRIWTQTPKRPGRGHFSHRIAFGPKGSAQEGKIFITSGDRQEQTPAQRMDMGLGKLIRLNDDGSVPADNPFQNSGELAKTFWTIGHRNSLGISFDALGQLWAHEMGPAHGDEINLIQRGQNYGWPVVSDGDNYSGVPIPDHNTRPDLAAPAKSWVPSIAPSGLVIYSGTDWPNWQGDAFIGGLVSQALIRVRLNGGSASEAERFEWGSRIREVEQAPDGSLWVLEDVDGRLLRLSR